MIVAMGFALFRLAVEYLPIFPKEEGIPVPLAGRGAVLSAVSVPEHAGD